MTATEYITAVEAAERLGITPTAVRVAIRNGSIPAKRFGDMWMLTPDAVEGARLRKQGRPFSDSPRCPCGANTLKRAKAHRWLCCRGAGIPAREIEAARDEKK